jgi:hypothetical protein
MEKVRPEANPDTLTLEERSPSVFHCLKFDFEQALTLDGVEFDP